MLAQRDRIFQNLQGHESPDLKAAQRRGDWKDISELTRKGREWIHEQVKISGLRGRGGAGFPTATKWAMIPEAHDERPHYLIINADEGEPGSCKDRIILRHEPHKIIEGALLAGIAIRARIGYVYIRGEYAQEADILQRAIDEAMQANLIGEQAGFYLYIHRGAGAYICGEETALLESLEGRKGLPRIKPPYPTQVGLYGCSTVINNVETLAVIPTILRRGGHWFSNLGRPNNAGTKIFCLSGHVNKPCLVEETLGVPLRDLIEIHAGGVQGSWDNLKAVIPGGASTPLLPKPICDTVLMDFDSLAQVGSALGTGGIIVMNQQTDIIRALATLARFYWRESCGQCTPCREGTGWIHRLLEHLATGQGHQKDLDTLVYLTSQINGHTLCAFGDAAAACIQGLIRHFSSDLQSHIKKD